MNESESKILKQVRKIYDKLQQSNKIITLSDITVLISALTYFFDNY
jgi:hypothetical protein